MNLSSNSFTKKICIHILSLESSYESDKMGKDIKLLKKITKKNEIVSGCKV